MDAISSSLVAEALKGIFRPNIAIRTPTLWRTRASHDDQSSVSGAYHPWKIQADAGAGSAVAWIRSTRHMPLYNTARRSEFDRPTVRPEKLRSNPVGTDHRGASTSDWVSGSERGEAELSSWQ